MNENVRIIEIARVNSATKFRSRGRIYSINGIAPCLNAVGGGNIEPKIIVRDDRVQRSI